MKWKNLIYFLFKKEHSFLNPFTGKNIVIKLKQGADTSNAFNAGAHITDNKITIEKVVFYDVGDNSFKFFVKKNSDSEKKDFCLVYNSIEYITNKKGFYLWKNPDHKE